MDKAIGILTVLAKNDETMDLSFCGGYVEICEALKELKKIKENEDLLFKASQELHVAYAKIVEQMAIEDFKVEPNIEVETEREWYKTNIEIAKNAILANHLNDDGTIKIG